MSGFLHHWIYTKYRKAILMTIDLLLVAAAFCIALLLKLDYGLAYYFRLLYLHRYIVVFIVYAVSFRIFRIHDSLWSYIGTRELFIMALSVASATGVIVIYLLITSIQVVLIKVSIIAGILIISLMLNVRVLYRTLLKRDRGSSDLQPALIIGAGDGGYLTLKEVEKNKAFNANVIGFVDDSRVGKSVAGKRVLGTTDSLKKLVEKYHIKKVYIAIPSAAAEDRRRLINLCQECNVEIKIMKKSEFLLVDNGEESYPIKPVSITDLLGRGETDLNTSQISGYLEGKIVLVSGAGGSIGSVLCRQIARFRPKQIILFDIYENNMYDLEQELHRQQLRGELAPDLTVTPVVGSVRDKASLLAVFEQYKPVVVFHAAAHKHVPLMESAPKEAVKNNIFGTRNIIEAAIASHADRLIFISTDKAVNPKSVMGATKRMAELIMQSYAGTSPTKMAAVRFGNVLGSNGSVIPLFEKQISEGGPVTLTHRDIERYFMTITEAAQLVMQAGAFADGGEIFVLDMGAPVRILDLAEKMIRLSGFIPYEDIDIVEVGLRPGEKLYEELSLESETVTETDNRAITVAKAFTVDSQKLAGDLAKLSSLIGEDVKGADLRCMLMKMIASYNESDLETLCKHDITIAD